MSDRPVARPHRSASGGISRRLLRDTHTLLEGGRLAFYALLEVLTMVRWTFATVLSLLGIGSVTRSFAAMERNADRQRRWASVQRGRSLTTSYEPAAPTTGSGLTQLNAQLADRARARDLDWHLVNPVASLAAAAAPLSLLGLSLWLLFEAAQAWAYRYDWYYASDYLPMVIFGLIGAVACLAAVPVVGRVVQRIHARWVGFMLATDVSESLEQRVATLSASRRTALELQEAEIRRIERDLHDGAQARLVTMGMTLTQAARAMENDPAAARELLQEAKGDSSAALSELRSLVRGIRPPILADRGLAEALRSLAAGSPIDTRVDSSLEERLVPTVETALYFAVAELLTNAVKHSAGSEIVVELSGTDEIVLAVVTDNGIGGAEERPEGGLAGLRRRLDPLDATLQVVSPVGGPTVCTVVVPRPVA